MEIERKKISNIEHIYDKNNKTVSKVNIQNKAEIIELAEKLINQNLEKPILWHFNNLQPNEIILTKNQVKNY